MKIVCRFLVVGGALLSALIASGAPIHWGGPGG